MSEDVPVWARGKTATEVLNLTKGVVDSFQRTNYSAPQPVVQPTPQNPTIDPEAYVTGRDVMALADQVVARIQGQPQPGVDAAASAVYGMAALKHPKEFQRYEPEIQGYLAGVPKANWTLDNIETIVSIVRGKHMVDYRSEWEQEFTSKLEPSMRSIGNAGTPPPAQDHSQSLESEKIPPDWKKRAQEAGLTESTIEEFCRKEGMTREQFFKLFSTGKVITEGTLV